MKIHSTFKTINSGLDRNSFPFRLFEKAKRLGTWNPGDLDFSKDREDWLDFSDSEKNLILHLTSLFQAGEEAVTLDLLPLISQIAKQGRLEEEMYLTTFLFEEAKHVDFFSRFLDEVAQHKGDLSHFASENYQYIIYQTLPDTLNQLEVNYSTEALVRASVTYNLIVEGVLAETGYHAYYSILERNNLMPGVREGISLLKRDESRHIAYGVYLLSRLLAEDRSLWEVLEDQMTKLINPTIGIIADIFADYDPMPFGLVADDFIDYAVNQYGKRLQRLEIARNSSLNEIDRFDYSLE